ncbi:hypothetical protein G7054_g11840 [Neopestalotiopsis clavispora]|nr:hypothetical protein G7054_g11840 [Neopestalotiopsis clavispora]
MATVSIEQSYANDTTLPIIPELPDLESSDFLNAPKTDCCAYPQSPIAPDFAQYTANALDQTGVSDALIITVADHATGKGFTLGQEDLSKMSSAPSLSGTDSMKEPYTPENELDFQVDGIQFVNGRFTGPGVWTASTDAFRPDKAIKFSPLKIGHGLWRGMCTRKVEA